MNKLLAIVHVPTKYIQKKTNKELTIDHVFMHGIYTCKEKYFKKDTKTTYDLFDKF